MNDTIELLKTDAAARELGISTAFLNKARLTGDGPRFIKIGGSVRYRLDDLYAYLEQQTFTSTSEAKASR